MGWKRTSDHVSEGFFVKPAEMQKMSKKTARCTKLRAMRLHSNQDLRDLGDAAEIEREGNK